MQIIDSGLFTILIPDKGYKLVNKTNGLCSKKVYLGKMDSPDNYGEIVDDKYVNMEYVVELSDMKENIEKTNSQNEMDINTILMAVDGMFNMFEPMLALMPNIMSVTDDQQYQPFINFYVCMIQRGLKTIDDIPDRFKEDVRSRI
jgi:hypothetical protein